MYLVMDLFQIDLFEKRMQPEIKVILRVFDDPKRKSMNEISGLIIDAA